MKGVKKPTTKLSHAQIIAQRVAQGGKFVEKKKAWTKGDIDRHLSAKARVEREEREAAAAASRAEAAAAATLSARMVRPRELARARMARLAAALQREPLSLGASGESGDVERLVACRELQLDELLVLESMYAGSGELLLVLPPPPAEGAPVEEAPAGEGEGPY